MWTFEPEVVRTATEVAYELLWSLAPAVAGRLPELEPPAPTGADELRFASALSQRIVGYLSSALG
jgi:hypothetical protein